MNRLSLRVACALVIVLMTTLAFGQSKNKGMKASKKLGWEVACQSYTFKKFTLEEAFSKMKELGISNAEIYSRQKVSSSSDLTTNYASLADNKDAILDLAKINGIEVESYGVISGKDEASWVQIFEFCKAVGIEIIASEPDPQHYALIDSLCNAYGIRIAIHNHPNPTRYWNPNIVLDALEGRSKMMGACADLGHWTRSGLDAAECLKKLEGRIFELHLKDVTGTTPDHKSIILGEGVIDFASVLKELKRQKFKGRFIVEYETNWDDQMDDMRKNLEYFYSEVGKL